jgi:enolase-phosphatase E1
LAHLPAFPADKTDSADTFLSHIRDLTASDSKASNLKALQGLLWRTGFENGDLVAPLFPDVVVALKRWHSEGKRLAIFSSGSVAAQKLFLTYTGVVGASAHCESEDLNGLFSGNFDTVNAGAKGDRKSYEVIAERLGVSEPQVLFLSDNVTGRYFSYSFRHG